MYLHGFGPGSFLSNQSKNLGKGRVANGNIEGSISAQYAAEAAHFVGGREHAISFGVPQTEIYATAAAFARQLHVIQVVKDG